MLEKLESVNGIIKKYAALAAALIGMVVLFISMWQGAGVGGDATIYITSARNLLEGNGLGLINPAGDFRLIPYFPPFYSLVLALFGLFGIDMTLIAKIINILCFGGLIFIITNWMTKKVTPAVWGLWLGLIFAFSPVLIPSYSWAMSEPLCCLLGFGGLILLEKYFSEKSTPALLLSALLCGLSLLTRYSSAAFVLCGALLTLFGQKTTWGKQILHTLLFGVIASLPMLLWLAYDYQMTETIASRSIPAGRELNPLFYALFDKLQPIVLQWFVPEDMSGPTFVNFLIFAVVLASMFFTVLLLMPYIRKEPTRIERIASLLASFFMLYLILISLVSVFTYPPITIGSRMFLPMYIAFMWLAAIGLSSVSTSKIRVVLKNTILIISVVFLLMNTLRGVRIARQNMIDGLGYNSTAWKQSETVAYVKENIPEDQLIVTNEETALLYLCDRATWPMHEVYVTEPDNDFYSYESGEVKSTDYGRAAFQNGEAVLVVFDTFEDQMRDIYGNDTYDRINALFENLQEVYDCDDGKVYSK